LPLQPVTPGLLSPLGTILGILIAFLAVRVWTNLDHAQDHIGREVTALREVVMLANYLPQDVSARVREAIGKHLDAIASEEWPAMAEERMNLRSFPPHLEEAMGAILSFAPVGANQQLVRNRALIAVEDAVEFRRNRVAVSRAEISRSVDRNRHSLGHDPRHHCRNPHQCATGDGGRDVCLFNGSRDVSCSPNGL
jgi:hypothetical protein